MTHSSNLKPDRTRLKRVTTQMVSGPDVLARRQHWCRLHMRTDRERYGWDGPAARPRWSHFAALLIGMALAIAFAGSPTP